MLPIFLCEDNLFQLEGIKNIIENFILLENFDMEILCATSSPYELLDCLNKHNPPALYFLDIDLSLSVTGFDLAEQIRLKDPRGFIVFITTYNEFSPIVFERQLEAMDYILKDNPEKMPKRILSCLNKAALLFSSSFNVIHPTFSFKCDSQHISIPFHDIFYITTCQKPHKLQLLSSKVVYEFFGSLQEIMLQLDSSFFLCHKSCIVNLNYIKSIHKTTGTITLMNGLTCPLSVRSYGPLMKHLKALKSLPPSP